MLIWRKWPQIGVGEVFDGGTGVDGRRVGGEVLLELGGGFEEDVGGRVEVLPGTQAEQCQIPRTYCVLRVSPLQRA